MHFKVFLKCSHTSYFCFVLVHELSFDILNLIFLLLLLISIVLIFVFLLLRLILIVRDLAFSCLFNLKLDLEGDEFKVFLDEVLDAMLFEELKVIALPTSYLLLMINRIFNINK